MKKLLYLALCIVLLVGMISCFAACGDDEEPTPTPTPSGTDNSTTGSQPSTENSGNGGNTDTSNSGGSTTDSSKDEQDSVDSGNGGSGGTDEEKPPEHTHTFASEYSYDENNHYYAATCEHTNEKTGIEPHSYGVYTGVCKCGHETTANLIENAIKVILDNRGSVKSGTSIYKYSYVEMNTQTIITTGYKFYEDYLYVRELSDYTNEYYYAVDSEDNSLFCVIVQKSPGNPIAVIPNKDASMDNLKGAEFNLSCLEDGDTIVYGAEELINYFYELAISEDSQDLVTVLKDGVFAISFVTCAVGDQAHLYNIGVGFSVDEATNSLSVASIQIDKYGSDSYALVDGKYGLVEGASPLYKYSYTINQSAEEIEYVENPYDPDKAKVDNVTVTTPDGVNIEETTYNLPAGGGMIEICLSDVTPSTAMIGLCEKDVIITNKEDGTKPSYYIYFDKATNSFKFSLSTPGSYTMTVVVDGIEYTTSVEVALRKPSAISSQVYNLSYSEFEQKTNAKVYVGAPLYFKSFVEQYCDGSYTASIVGDVDEVVASIVDGEINGNKASVFTANQVGTYKIKIESTVMANKSCVLTVNVVEAPSVENILSGTYMGIDADGTSTINLTFDTESSTIEVELTEFGFTTKEVISYAYADGKLTYEYVSGDDIVTSFYLTEGYELVIVVYDDYKFLLESTSREAETVATGTLVLEDLLGNGAYSGTYKFVLDSNDVFTFYKGEAVTTDISLTVENGVYTFKYQGADAQKLIKLEGTAGELTGKYKTESSSVNVTITVDVPEPVIFEGTLDLTDSATGNQSNSYTGSYPFVCVDGVFTFYKDGEVYDKISLSIENGIYTFKFPSVTSECSLVKTKGDEESIEGTYSVQMGIGIPVGTVVITFKGEEAPVPQEYVFNKGVNYINVENGTVGTKATFTATKECTYKISFMPNEENVVIWLVTESGKEKVTLPYEFELKANESIEFMVYTANGEADKLEIVIEEVTSYIPELPDDEF